MSWHAVSTVAMPLHLDGLFLACSALISSFPPRVIHVHESPWMDGSYQHMPSVKQEDCRRGTLQCRAHDAGCDRRKTGPASRFQVTHLGPWVCSHRQRACSLAGKRKLVCCPSGLYTMTDGCCRRLFTLELVLNQQVHHAVTMLLSPVPTEN